MPARCVICAKHRGQGPYWGPKIWADENVLVYHRSIGSDEAEFLGYLFIETRRHVSGVDDLTEVEALAVARAVWRAARGLRAELHPAAIFSAIVGRSVPHFHQHVFVRYPDTPEEFGWTQVDDWQGAPRGGPADLRDLAARLGPYLSGIR